MEIENKNQEQKNIFAKNLMYWLKERGKTQTDLMKDLALSSSTVSDWCNAKKYPRMDKIQMLADYLSINKSDLTESKEVLEDEKAFFRVMKDAQAKGYSPKDIQLAIEFLERARERDKNDN